MKTISPTIQQRENRPFEPPFFLKFKKIFQKSFEKSVPQKKEKKVSVFLVDDDSLYLKALELSISSYLDDVTIQTFETGEACLQQMKKKPSIVILDYYLNSQLPYAWNGISILKQIKMLSPKTKVIMLSSQDSLKVAIDCMENGAYDYISKSQTALIRVNNCITNIVDNIDKDSVFFKLLKYIVIIVVITMITYAILSH
jgi:ActR/RegA family two-component response regulator